MNDSATTDEELRKMRDTVYPAQNDKQVQGDESWNQVKAHWRKDEAWLRHQYALIKWPKR